MNGRSVQRCDPEIVDLLADILDQLRLDDDPSRHVVILIRRIESAIAKAEGEES